MIPQRLGEFTIINVLGEGAHGVVYRARDGQGREVALKVLREMHGADGDLQRRFLRESTLSIGLVHPNVVRAFASGHIDGNKPYLSSELVSGGSLLELIDKHGRLDVERTLRAAADLFRGLEAIHRQGLVHRDIKPANVLLAGDGTAKVADLGLCRTTSVERAHFTVEGAIVGTPAYVAPEQIERGDAIDIRADLYAAGVLLYQCLSGKLPLGGSTVLAILQAHLSQKPRPLRELVSVPTAVEQLINDLLEKDPARRPRDPKAALERLAAINTSAMLATITEKPAAFAATMIEMPVRPGVPLGMRPNNQVFPSTIPEGSIAAPGRLDAFPRTLPDGAFPAATPARVIPSTMPERPFPGTVVAGTGGILSGNDRTISPSGPVAPFATAATMPGINAAPFVTAITLSPLAGAKAPESFRLRSSAGTTLFCYAGPEVILGRDAPRDDARQICLRLFPAATMAERSLRISSKHCSLLISATGVRLRDLGSSHGTTVDGRPVPRNGDAPVIDGSRIRLADALTLRVRFIPSAHPGAQLIGLGDVPPWPAVLLTREDNGNHHRYLMVSAPVAIQCADPALPVGQGDRLLCGSSTGLWWCVDGRALPVSGPMPATPTPSMCQSAPIHPDDHKG